MRVTCNSQLPLQQNNSLLLFGTGILQICVRMQVSQDIGRPSFVVFPLTLIVPVPAPPLTGSFPSCSPRVSRKQKLFNGINLSDYKFSE